MGTYFTLKLKILHSKFSVCLRLYSLWKPQKEEFECSLRPCNLDGLVGPLRQFYSLRSKNRATGTTKYTIADCPEDAGDTEVRSVDRGLCEKGCYKD